MFTNKQTKENKNKTRAKNDWSYNFVEFAFIFFLVLKHVAYKNLNSIYKAKCSNINNIWYICFVLFRIYWF